MTPAFLPLSLALSLLQRLACWVVGHNYGARRSIRCLRCGVRCVEAE